MDFSLATDYYHIRAALNDIISKIEKEVEEVEDDDVKSSKVNGWHLFHKNCCNQIVLEAEYDENEPPSTQAEMSKVSASKWKSLTAKERKDWNDQGQRIRENQDLGTAIKKSTCRICGKSFNRERDCNHHEKKCGNVTCVNCGKQFGDKVALKRHMKNYIEDFSCNICKKRCSTKQSLFRHKETHSKKEIPCPVCGKSYSSRPSMLRHHKSHHTA